MAGTRKTRSAAFKAQVVMAALKGDKTINELARQYGVHTTLIYAWKKQLVAGAEGVFSNGGKPPPPTTQRKRHNSTSRSAGSRWNWAG